MYQYDDPTVSPTLPPPSAASTPGFFTDGNPSSGVAATELRSDFMNMLMMESLNVVTASGQTPSKNTYNQILLALQACFAPVTGEGLNVVMSVTAASANATMTADEIVVKSALGGMPFVLKAFNQTINLASVGAGGMDSGAAPINGYVAIYAIFDPATRAEALLATNATAAAAPSVYGGANMPEGYTASSLRSVWPTNGSGQLVPGYQQSRKIWIGIATVLASNVAGSFTSISLANFVPPNAKTISGTLNAGNTASGGSSITVLSGTAVEAIGQKSITMPPNASANQQETCTYEDLPLATKQTAYYQITVSSGTPYQNGFSINAYTF